MSDAIPARLEDLLTAVRRRIRTEHASRVLWMISWIILAMALLVILAHFLVRSLDVRWLLGLISLPVAWAIGSALARRPQPAECADWADRHLEGNSAFATFLETSAMPQARDSSALAHLLSHVDERASRALSALGAMPPEHRFVRPLVAGLVCASLAAALLQVPGRGTIAGDESLASVESRSTRGPADAAVSAQAQMDASSSSGRQQDALDVEMADRLDGKDPDEPLAPGPLSEEGEARKLEGAQTTGAEAAAEGSTEAGPSSEPAGGREAGTSRDRTDGMQATDAWQGALVARLRKLVSRDTDSQQQADPGTAAEFTNDAPSRPGAAGSTYPEPLPAVAPLASETAPLDPAAQAYVRRYFDSAGDDR
jgi:hypothetical protein